MVINDTSTKDGLLQNCESLCNLGDTGITGNAVLKAKFVSWLNQSMDKMATAILTVDKNWRLDDVGSYGNFAIATTDLTSGQRDYVLPRATNSSDYSTLWKLYKVRLKDTNGNWYDLIPLASDESENPSNSTGRPTKYRMIGNSIRLSDIPLAGSLTLTSGIQVWFSRMFVKFTDSDTTKQPPFASNFHYLMPLDASATFLLPTNPDKAASYIILFKQGIEELKTHYATRNDDPQTTKRVTPAVEDNK